MTFCKEMRRETDIYWKGSFEHPFILRLADGTLPLENFKFYMMQDAYYLKHYAKILGLTAVKADRTEEMLYFLNMAHYITEAELDLHQSVFKELGVTEEEWSHFQEAPAAYEYVSHMYNAVYNGDLSEAFASMLPCPWLYCEIGQRIKQQKPGFKLYQDWINLYSSDEYRQKIDYQIKLMNRFAEHTDKRKHQKLKKIFAKSCYYELAFWEMAMKKQGWIPRGIN